MKKLNEYIIEKLIVNKDYNINNASDFDKVDEVYGLSWHKLDKTFYIAKYEIEDICEINNNPVRYEITGASTYYGFKNMQCKLIKDYNILYNDGPRNFILIHPDDKEKLELLLKFADKLEPFVQNTLDYILKNKLKIDYTNFIKFGIAYGQDAFDYYKCDMGEGTIKDLRKVLANSLK